MIHWQNRKIHQSISSLKRKCGFMLKSDIKSWPCMTDPFFPGYMCHWSGESLHQCSVCINLHFYNFGTGFNVYHQETTYKYSARLYWKNTRSRSDISKLFFFHWDISVIFAEKFWSFVSVVLKLAITVFFNLNFQTFWPKWLKKSFQSMTEKKQFQSLCGSKVVDSMIILSLST